MRTPTIAASILFALFFACEFPGAEPIADPQPPIDPPADTPDADDDGDGVANAVDNCWALYNPDQRDEDRDDRGDLCDNCPVTANHSQRNDGELDAGELRDELGDACDPRPRDGGDRIGLFEPFNKPLEPSEWSFSSGSTDWIALDGALTRRDVIGTGTIYYSAKAFGEAVVESSLRVENMIDGGDLYGVALVMQFNGNNGYACIEKLEDGSNQFGLAPFTPTVIGGFIKANTAEPELAAAMELGLRASAEGRKLGCDRDVFGGAPESVEADGPITSGMVGLHTYQTAASFEHLIVYELGGERGGGGGGSGDGGESPGGDD